MAMVFLQGKPGASIFRAITETRAPMNGGFHDAARPRKDRSVKGAER
jgi:hypothetical protein